MGISSMRAAGLFGGEGEVAVAVERGGGGEVGGELESE
jgi:hypothetical protein